MDLTAFAAEVGSEDRVTVVGGSTQWDVGGGVDASARRVRAPMGVAAYDPAEMTVRCGAGTTVADLDRVLAEHGQTVALPDWDGATVGGVLAVGRSGIRRLGYGPVRDVLLEARYVSAAGTVVKAGGPTVKNVSGFDLCRMLVGSLGTLGFLAETVLRVRPLPIASRWFATDADPFALFRDMHHPISLLWDGTTTWVLLEGHPDDIDGQARTHALRPADGPPALPAGRRSLRPTGLRSLMGAGGFVAEIGVGVVHTDEQHAARATEPHRIDLHHRLKAAFDPTNRLNPGAARRMIVNLDLDDRELAACVACGLCLPYCPTYRVTGEESASPRGRIAAMRAVQWEGHAPDASFASFMELCVQCRACEVACPSSVPFGHLMEGAREALAEGGRGGKWWQRRAFAVLAHHRALLTLSTLGALAQRLHLVPKRMGLPRLPIRRPRLASTGSDVYLFTGCAMDAWLRPAHVAAINVLGLAGAGVALPGPGGDCCGALHVHAGFHDDAVRLAQRVMGSMPGDAPILVDAAGCGAAMKDFGRLVGTAAAVEFSARVADIHEWLAAHVDRLPPPASGPRRRVVVQDPCHLRHVQKAHGSVRTVLSRYVDVAELDDDGLCCGAGGAYAVLQPKMAGALRDRKVAAIAATGSTLVASANPGCVLHLAGAGLDVRHPLEIVEEVVHGR